MRRLLLAVVAAAASLSLGGCGSEAPRMAPLHRFVDLEHPSNPPALLPVATLLDETRYVLRGHPEARLVRRTRPVVTVRAHLSLRPRLPGALRGSSQVVLSPRIELHGEWVSLASSLASVRSAAGEPFVPVELDLPKAAVGSTVTLVIDGYALPPTSLGALETPSVEIPAGSRLEFGIGVLDPARDQGPVAFSVQACEENACGEIFGETLDPAAPEGRGWHDRSVSLEAYAGAAPSFRFETALLDESPRAFSLPVWSNPTVYAPERRGTGHLNVVLLSLDTLRADHLPSYGYPLDTAPFIEEKFGRSGAVFETLVAAATTTGPSHMSLFTSLQPSVHGVTGGPGRLPIGAVTLAQTLRSHGFETGAVTENAALDVRRGFGRGFDSYAENKSQDVAVAEGHVEETFARVRRWLARHGDERFFLFVHTYQVHYPYTPPDAYRHLFGDPAEGHEPHAELPPDRDPALYDREIRYLDDQLRSLFDALEQMELDRDTLVILTSDHGEEFLEHGSIGHGPTVHAEVTHVPLMLWGPAIPRGRRFAGPVGHIDLMPTILALAGVPPPDSMMGRSFAPRLREEVETPPAEAVPIFAEAWYGESIRRSRPALAVRLGERKLIRYPTGDSFRYQYYDLARDPHERSDRYPGAAAEASDLKRLIDTYAEAIAPHSAALRRKERLPEPDLGIDPEREAKLRALGYLE